MIASFSAVYQGIFGLYAGYMPSMLRNVPSAIVRFTVYEEIKQRLGHGMSCVVMYISLIYVCRVRLDLETALSGRGEYFYLVF